MISNKRTTATLALALAGAISAAALFSGPTAGALSTGTALAAGNGVTPTYSDCAAGDIVNPFVPYGDLNDYVLVHNGSFEADLDGWTVDSKPDKVSVVSLADRGNVLQMESGASVTSPPICFDEARPHARLFLRQILNEKGDSKNGELTVKVLYTRSDIDKAASIGVGDVKIKPKNPGSDVWNPSPEIGTGLDDAQHPVGADEQGQRWFQLQFQVKGPAIWQLDDLYIDPRRRS